MSEFIEEEKAGAQAIAELMAGKKTIVVAGAGMSTDAGIPDYRGTGSSGMPTVDMDQFLGELYLQKWVAAQSRNLENGSETAAYLGALRISPARRRGAG